MKTNRTYHKRGELLDGFRCRKHPSYSVWAGMMSRCYNPNTITYSVYGGRGIKVDRKWHHFKNFVKDMGARPDKSYTIERKDNFVGYFKSNCLWATRSDQCVNRRLLKTNTSGRTGIIKVSPKDWRARFDYCGVRYNIGNYTSLEEASLARDKFVNSFKGDPAHAISKLTTKENVIWKTSSSKVRGVSVHNNGGYISRCTIDGVRYYVGYYRTLEEAKYERSKFIKIKTKRVIKRES